jgi:DNA-binding CsgD family transcriptional regulator
MSPQDIAASFAERLGRLRALTQEETDMLQSVIEKRSPYWTSSEVETVRRMRAAGKRAPTIARAIGRSSGSVNSKLRNMKRRDARG